MVKIERLSHIKELQIELRNLPFRDKWRILWRKGWLQIPAVMAGIPFMVVGLVCAGIPCINFDKERWRYAKYQNELVIYRADDPEVKKIRHTSGIDY